MKLVVVPNNMRSKSAKRLANTLSAELGYKVYRVAPNRVRRRVAFTLPKGTDKLTQLKSFNEHGINCPDYTTDIGTARDWADSGSTVVCRRLLLASSGKGIVIAETPDEVVPARLYTRYVPKKQEFRVHVFDGRAIDVQLKKKRRGYENERDTRVRNLANGYVFCRENIVEPEGLRGIAVDAVRALGYSIGAVDIVHNVKKKKLVVLEVNANPGMEGTTLRMYAKAIVDKVKGRA